MILLFCNIIFISMEPVLRESNSHLVGFFTSKSGVVWQLIERMISYIGQWVGANLDLIRGTLLTV